uniref:Palmitoyl-protein thioesterase 1 n=1 Tax=Acrobeloides nanus TaxID=290746 RepID=A0A914DK61_9BILA
MGDSCCNPLSMGRVKKLLMTEIPNVYVHSLMLGDSFVTDTEHGFFANMNDLVAEACQKIESDENLKNGYNAIGFSQGGLFVRAIAQRCPNPPMKTLISFGGPQQGVYGFPYCPGEKHTCDLVRHLLNYGAYVSFVQNKVVQAQYWHDPYQKDDYIDKNIFLADLNNERQINQSYNENLAKLENFVTVKFLRDHMIEPKESAWFGYYPRDNTSVIVPLEESELFTKQLTGLKKLAEANRLKFESIDGDHLQIPHDVFVNQFINKYLKN